MRRDPMINLAWAHIAGRRHDLKSLAKALGVSTATASRTLAALRDDLEKDGIELAVVRVGRRSFYEIRDEEVYDSLWRGSRFAKLAGFVKEWRAPRGKSVKDLLYARDRS
ncbi:MAG: hypothetical protein HYY18_08045 [Planctomycetes bacterium]|nr:hypothetical protein [Planctomycetota bacterium]